MQAVDLEQVRDARNARGVHTPVHTSSPLQAKAARGARI
jgi:hypothetical protein